MNKLEKRCDMKYCKHIYYNVDKQDLFCTERVCISRPLTKTNRITNKEIIKEYLIISLSIVTFLIIVWVYIHGVVFR